MMMLAVASTLIFASCNQTKESSTDNSSAANEGATATEILASNANEKGVVNAPIHLSTADFKKLVTNYDDGTGEFKYLSDKPAIIDFWADWCAPCRVIAPVLDELAEEYADQIYIFKLDVEAEKEVASVFGIRSIPTLLFVPMDGEPRAELGAVPKEMLVDRIDNFLLSEN